MSEVSPPSSDTHVPNNYEQLAGILEMPLLGPELTEEDIAHGCEVARRYGLASVIVRPSDLDLAERWTGPSLALGVAIDWPYGYSTTAVKQYAVRDALRRGAKEVTVALNTSKLVSRQFQYLEMELLQISAACREVRALLTINLESQYLNEEHKIVGCRVAKRVAADYIAVTEPSDIALLRSHARERVQLKLRGAATLEAALHAFNAGCARIETSFATAILDAWKAHLAPTPAGPEPQLAPEPLT